VTDFARLRGFALWWEATFASGARLSEQTLDIARGFVE
jgi:hypothetical protein